VGLKVEYPPILRHPAVRSIDAVSCSVCVPASALDRDEIAGADIWTSKSGRMDVL
jgi:hypothetical protein